MSLTKVTYSMINGPQLNAANYGVVGDGTTDDTAALQSAINALASGDTLVIGGNCKITSSLTVTNKTRVRITGKGIITLNGATGDYIFKLVGTIDDLEIDSLTLIGTNNAAYSQVAVGNDSGQTISNVKFHDLTISQINVGISLNANLSGSYTKAWVYNNSLKDILGTASGQGYGIQLAKATYCHIYENTIDNASRHSIYHGAGTNVNNVIADNTIINHRSTVADATYKCAIVVSRSSNVTVTGNKLYNYSDGGMEISHVTTDSASCSNILVYGNSFVNRQNNVPDVIVGEQAVPGSYSTYKIDIKANMFDTDVSVAGSNPTIYILNGSQINVTNNTVRKYGVTSVLPEFVTLGNDTYATANDDIYSIVVENNQGTSDAVVSATFFTYICTILCTGTSTYSIKNNFYYGWETEFSFATTPGNPNSKLKFQTSVVFDTPSIAANTGYTNALSVVGAKPTSSVTGRPQYSILTGSVVFTFYAKDDQNNKVGIQANNATGSPVNEASQTFLIAVEDF